MIFHACHSLVPSTHVLYCVVRYWLTKEVPF